MTTLRHDPPARVHDHRPTVEELIDGIATLVLERQSLRSSGASDDVLEHNRSLLVSAHWELSRALIERHCAPKPAAA